MEEKKELLQTSVLQPKGGGTKDNPYIISDTDTFLSIHDNLSAFYRLEKDINFGGATLTPIGTQSLPFTGGFDGAGYALTNFVINVSGYGGLFGYIREAALTDLMLEGAQVMSTSSCVGMLAGYMYGGSVDRCCAEGTVKGFNQVGGLIGYAGKKADISNSYARGNVTATSSSAYAGGFIGCAQDVEIRNSYAACTVSKSSSSYGFAYIHASATVEDSYYDSQISGFNNNAYNVGKLTIALTNMNFFRNWDFENIWNIVEGETYPYLKNMGKMAGGTIDLGFITEGDGTEENPYRIQDASGLNLVQNDLAGCYRLKENIDYAGVTVAPIGTHAAPFTGGFDGAGHAIKNLVIDEKGYAGLFGYIKMADLRGLMLESVQVTSTNNYAGALAGCMQGGSVSECCAEGTVKGYTRVGGLIGYACQNAVIDDSYARGSVMDSSSYVHAGGLVGYAENIGIRNSYASCIVDKSSSAYGLAYVYSSTTVENSYYDIQVTGYKSSMYNVGKLTVALTNKNFFKAWDFENVWEIEEGKTYPYLKSMGRMAGGEIDLGYIKGGAGTEEDPYQIQDANGLSMVQNDLAGWYRLLADIDFAGEMLTPIGTQLLPFTGGFDGFGHSIRNFCIDAVGYAGLFGYTSMADLRGLMLEGVRVKVIGISNYAGALAGYMEEGRVSRCCAEGIIEGAKCVGGLIGYAGKNSVISDSYARGSVTGKETSGYVGGLIGLTSQSDIRNSYAACEVSKNTSTCGLSGITTYATVDNSYYDSQITGYMNDMYNIGKLTVALTKKIVFKLWDFESIWDIQEGRTYPYLKCMGRIAGGEIELKVITEGAGIEESPYQIKDANGLSMIQNDLAGWYRLTEDINLNSAVHISIGTQSVPFSGGFDGAGHSIRNFIISRDSYAGFFGYIAGAALKNLMLEEAQVEATGNHAGILAGYMRGGSVNRCCAEGSVAGNSYVGGLVGRAYLETDISDSYGRGSVKATEGYAYAGGLVGYAEKIVIRNCYAACTVSGNGGFGLANVSSATTVENSYYDSQVMGINTTNEYNIGKLTAALTNKGFLKIWDFEEIWAIAEGETYPYLKNMGRLAGTPINLGFITIGAGTEEIPYHVGSIDALNMIQIEMGGWYKLTEDIDLEGKTIVPIGKKSSPFTGGFDGAGHTIRNLNIDAEDYIGLFGYSRMADIKNLMLENAQVNGAGYYVGTLAGYMQGGNISRCCAEGSIRGKGYVGGLIGYACQNTIVSDSYARGSVTAISGNGYAGGLIGYTQNTAIRNSYAACTVSESGYGLVHVYSATIVEDSYFDSQVAGYKSNAYNVGKLTAGLMSKNFLKNWDFEEIWTIVAGETYPYLKCMGKLAGGSIDPGFITDGAGTEENPYWVKDLGGLSLIPKDLAGQYCLAADIDFDGAAITPIGTESLPFTGGFSGNGHTISNYVLSTSSYAGLFGYAREAELRDLILKKAEVISTGSYTGALAAYMENCTVRNISQSEITVTGGSYTGALSGYARKGSIIGCCARKNILVTGTSGVGGLVGTVTDSSTILKECCTTANVTGSTYVGGIAGLLECSIVNSYATGSVISATDNLYTGGLAGCIRYESINSCYAACSVSKNGSGLANLFSATVTNSFFDSNLAGLTTPTEQARTTDQMLTVRTYIGWDWENVWDYKENHYPNLRNIEFIMQEPFELAVNMLTHFSVVIEWPVIPDAKNYQISYLNIEENVTASRVLIEDLVPETEYEFRVCAQISDVTRIWSKKLRVKTKKIMSVLGLHSIGKGPDSITLVWDPAEHAETYEVTYNGCIQSVKTNECTLTGLNTGIPYMIRVKALISDGSSIISDPIMEKIYRLDPQTEYAKEFINKCEGQTWFMDEIENLLNLKGKSINTIQSREDFTSIFAIGLANRGIGGMIPAAIGELYRLEYLFLANNKLNGKVPDELSLLKHLAEADFTGNQIQI